MKTNKYKQIYTAFSIVFLMGCFVGNQDNNDLPKVLFKTSEIVTNSDSSGNEGLAIRFYKDGTYSHFGFNFYAYGKFSFNKEKSILKLEPTICKDSCQTVYYKIEEESSNNYILKNTEVTNGKVRVLQSNAQAWGTKKIIGTDPFAKELNTWRIKPKQSETAEQIKNRTVQYLKFLQVYHEFVLLNNIDFITTSWYATPLKMHYRNGVKMVYSNELTDWYACFYNVEEGNEGYKLINGAMKNSQIKGKENIAERNADYLKQLIKVIEGNQFKV